MSNECTLCHLKCVSTIVDGDKRFCCSGCHTVYQILESQGFSAGYRDSPLFEQALRFGLISNPELFQKESLDLEIKRLYLEVVGMWCPSCAHLIELLMQCSLGVKSCFVDYTTDLASIEYYPKIVSSDDLLKKITALGYKPKSIYDKTKSKTDFQLLMRLGVALFAALNIMMFSYPIYERYLGIATSGYNKLFAWASLLLALPVVFYSAKPIFKRFWVGLKVFLFGMESLVVIGISSSMILSLWQLAQGRDAVYFDSMSMIVVFVLWGKVMEGGAKRKTKEMLTTLKAQHPKKARKKMSNGTFTFVPIKEVEVGSLVTSLTGEKIVLDGLVEEGEGLVDESLLTGEAMPLRKICGDPVIGGSILKQGMLTFKVMQPLEDTLLQKVSALLEHDIVHRKRESKIIDQITRFFVPSIFLTALICGFSFGFDRFLAVLLVSCPCAIGIALPLVEAILMNRLLELGIIIKDRSVLKLLGKIDLIIFDKTGTITEGKFKVLNKIELEHADAQALRGLTLSSSHPISTAIADSILTIPASFSYVEEVIGKGIKGICEDRIYYLGSYTFLKENGFDPPLNDKTTTVYFAKADQLLCMITLGDTLRDNIKEAIESLSIKEKVILSGDNKGAVKGIADACGILNWESGFSPYDKRAFIDRAKKEKKIVAMIGDGVNDALAISGADVGISLVSGCDLSIHMSDVFVTTPHLCHLEKMRYFCKKASKIANQNLFWAFFYNIIGVTFALFGFFPPIVAAAAMTLSSLLVIINSNRVRRIL